MVKIKYLSVIPVLTVLLYGSVVLADGFGQVLDKVAGNYIANVDYDSYTSEIYAQSSTSFSFQLWNKDRTELVPFSDVSVNIFEKDNPDTSFSGTLSGGFSQAGMKYIFKNPGSYTMQVRFHNEKYETLADATFPLTVFSKQKYTIDMFWTMLSGVIGFLLGGAALRVYDYTVRTKGRK